LAQRADTAKLKKTTALKKKLKDHVDTGQHLRENGVAFLNLNHTQFASLRTTFGLLICTG